MIHTFSKIIENPSLDPLEDETILADITYRVEDIGVMMKRDEHLVATIVSVQWEGRELADDLDPVTRGLLEAEAFDRWQDERERRFDRV